MRPADALIALADQLRARGFTALYGSACNRFRLLLDGRAIALVGVGG